MSAEYQDQISSHQIHIGKGVFIHPTAVICGPDGGKAARVQIGDHTYIGERVVVRCADFSIGDYSKIHHDTNIHGYLPCHIGHNAWIGQFTIIDSIGGTTIGDNCGIGAHSQLWSHIKYGDTLEGCRFLMEKPLTVGKDVWFVGHCIISPINAEDRSMAMVGSVVTKDMKTNTIYAGSPASEISSKIGPQFRSVTTEEKLRRMEEYLVAWGGDTSRIRVVGTIAEIGADDVTSFAVAERVYTKRNTVDEIAFMKYLLPARGKFTPITRG